MKITYLILLYSLMSSVTSAQCENDKAESNGPVFTYTVKSEFNAEGAKKDIKEKRVHVLFSATFLGAPDFKDEKDIAFQKKYSVEFYSQGCIRMGEDENVEQYNQVIFSHLDKNYGREWRSEIRNGAIGLK